MDGLGEMGIQKPLGNVASERRVYVKGGLFTA